MKVLLIGGTGLISTGIVTHLLSRGAAVTLFNRGKRENRIEGEVEILLGDRNDPAALSRCVAGRTWDAVIDMVCFTPAQAEAAIRIFAGKCRQFIFCSTVCTYGVKIPSEVVVDESFPQEPISGYGRNKLACEELLMEAQERGDFETTFIRPSCTYGPGASLIDNLEFDPVAWDRIEKGLPVLCAGDGLGLWVSTHRDDVGKLFAYAVLNEKTYGEDYNATRDLIFTWRDVYRETAAALGRPAQVLFMPADWIVAHDPDRFGLLREITAFHGAYTSEKAQFDVPEFDCEVDYPEGAAQTLEDLRRRGAWRRCEGDAVYEAMVEKALAAGVQPVTL
ncbi:MAG: NAD-dependent epimerase/dehydratase family protein [Puniceicoccaceae bacterium]|nr:MAG: NAD-dependent epimerase/dehydratase family protein [Puniceicoccaceae bacterium]